ncbi:MAG: cyclase family protein [Clostridiaceae bacterium]
MNYIDLTHSIKENLISYSRDETPHISPLSTIADNGFEVNRLIITTHTSTHVDAPKHIFDDGNTIDKLPLESCFGKAFVMDFSKYENTIISLEIFCKYYQHEVDYILFYTGAEMYWNTNEYLNNYKYPSLELCNYLSNLPIKGIGMDTISVDSNESELFENHKVLLKNNKIIIENLKNLSLLKDKLCDIYIFPLKVHNGDGGPARVIAKI